MPPTSMPTPRLPIALPAPGRNPLLSTLPIWLAFLTLFALTTACASVQEGSQEAAQASQAPADPAAAQAPSQEAPSKESTNAVAELVGHWEGQILIPGQPMEVQIDLSRGEAGWEGTASIPPQGLRGLPLKDLKVDGTSVAFGVTGLPGKPTFDGEVDAQGFIRGQFLQATAHFPFELEKKGEAPGAYRRPQTPSPPFPYRSEEVTFGHEEEGQQPVQMAATLTLPRGPGPFPALFLVTGSGLQDRDSTIYEHKPFLVLADHLTRAGIAVLRADDRGYGASKGSLDGVTSSDFTEDALAGIRFLSEHPEIDPDRIGILGHSEGGMIAPMAASRSDDISYVIMLAGLAVPGIEVLPAQAAKIAEANGVPAVAASMQAAGIRQQLELVASAKSEEEAFRKLDAWSRQQLLAAKGSAVLSEEESKSVADQARQYSRDWFRFFLTFDPAEAIAQVDVPILVLNGSLDTQVLPEQHLPVIEKVLKEAGNPDVTIRELEGLNHLFQTANTGSPAEYAEIEQTLAPEVLDIVTEWIVERFGAQEVKKAA